MTGGSPPPSDVDQFILTHIDSVPHLESLVLLLTNRDASWSIDEIAMRLYIEPEKARKILQDLVREGFVGICEREDFFRYNPKSEEQDSLIQRVATAYGRELIRISSLIHSKASPAVREFARAFRFTKDKD